MIEDTLRRFLLEKIHVRGEWVHLDQSWQTLLSQANYPDKVRDILGEALSAVILLSATVKHQGSLVLQIQGNGPLHLLVVQATPQGTFRGLARWSKDLSTAQSMAELFGKARMVVTLEAPDNGERYQGIIALDGNSITAALEQYFQQSEQLPTRLWLSSDAQHCAGMLIQRLPPAEDNPTDLEQQADDWQRVSMLLDTLTTTELKALHPEQLIYRLFHEEEPRLLDFKSMRFQCSCNKNKVETMLHSLGKAEALSIIEEQGIIEVSCEFCNATYRFDAVDIAQLFTDGVVEPISHTLH